MFWYYLRPVINCYVVGRGSISRFVKSSTNTVYAFID